MTLDTHAGTTTITPNDGAEPARTAPTRPDPRRIAWYRPATDVAESADAFQLTLDAPGVAPSAFELTTEGRTLIVSGVRADGERGWRRAFNLSAAVDAGRITARAENGVLTVTLPKAEAAKPRRIAVG